MKITDNTLLTELNHLHDAIAVVADRLTEGDAATHRQMTAIQDVTGGLLDLIYAAEQAQRSSEV